MNRIRVILQYILGEWWSCETVKWGVTENKCRHPVRIRNRTATKYVFCVAISFLLSFFKKYNPISPFGGVKTLLCVSLCRLCNWISCRAAGRAGMWRRIPVCHSRGRLCMWTSVSNSKIGLEPAHVGLFLSGGRPVGSVSVQWFSVCFVVLPLFSDKGCIK